MNLQAVYASGGGGKELVPFDARGDSTKCVLRLDSQDAGVAADANVAGQRDLLRKSEDELDRASGLKSGLDQKIKAAKTDISGLAVFLRNSIVSDRKPDFHGQRHRKTPCGPALHTVFHSPSP